MLFSSFVFLFAFLPVLIFIYYAVPRSYRNAVLLVFSLFFYAWGGVSYTLILLFSILVNYLFVQKISKNTASRKKWLYAGVSFNVAIIVVFKYLDFFIENINWLSPHFFVSIPQLPLRHIVLPLGISFFTFQQISLLRDVYKNETKEKVSFSNIALYVSFFPQLIAGPIVRYNDILHQIKSRRESISLFYSGTKRFIIGLFKKIVLANTCGELADRIMSNSIDDISTPIAWLGIICYSFQIYFDFSGYSDMAIGLGRMFGFRILENFNLPYISKSIQEFWRRWHISLSSWFRDYVYIPLGGDREGKVKTYVNLLIVFLLTGFWHGATWSFVVWGLFHGLFITLERLGFKKFLLKVPAVFRWVYTMLVVSFGWVFFRIEELPSALKYIGKLIGIGQQSSASLVSYLNLEIVLTLVVAILLSSSALAKVRFPILRIVKKFPTVYQLGVNAFLAFLFAYSVLLINSGSYNPFIYFRF